MKTLTEYNRWMGDKFSEQTTEEIFGEEESKKHFTKKLFVTCDVCKIELRCNEKDFPSLSINHVVSVMCYCSQCKKIAYLLI